MHVPDSFKALPLVLAACGGKDSQTIDTSWAEDTGTPPAELTAGPCEGMDAELTVDVGATDVPALCLRFTAAEETALTHLLISDVYGGAWVDERAGQLYDAKEGGTALSDLEVASLDDSSLRFDSDSNIAVTFPADQAYELWVRVDVGTSAGTYQAALLAADNIATDPAGLQPGGTYGTEGFRGPKVIVQ